MPVVFLEVSTYLFATPRGHEDVASIVWASYGIAMVVHGFRWVDLDVSGDLHLEINIIVVNANNPTLPITKLQQSGISVCVVRYSSDVRTWCIYR